MVRQLKKTKKIALSEPLIGPSNPPLDLTMIAPLYHELICWYSETSPSVKCGSLKNDQSSCPVYIPPQLNKI
jgi:hypothetical protein